MVMPLFITLILGLFALIVGYNVNEEVESLSANLCALFLLLLSLYLAPLWLKLAIFSLLILSHRQLYHSSSSNGI